jgi:hypothetical protein
MLPARLFFQVPRLGRRNDGLLLRRAPYQECLWLDHHQPLRNWSQATRYRCKQVRGIKEVSHSKGHDWIWESTSQDKGTPSERTGLRPWWHAWWRAPQLTQLELQRHIIELHICFYEQQCSWSRLSSISIWETSIDDISRIRKQSTCWRCRCYRWKMGRKRNSCPWKKLRSQNLEQIDPIWI